MTGKIAIVTGSNTGIGKETARELARKGAHVIVAARSKEKGERAVADIVADTESKSVEFLQLDLANLASVREFAKTFKAKHEKLHLLINNAGVMGHPMVALAQRLLYGPLAPPEKAEGPPFFFASAAFLRGRPRFCRPWGIPRISC